MHLTDNGDSSEKAIWNIVSRCSEIAISFGRKRGTWLVCREGYDSLLAHTLRFPALPHINNFTVKIYMSIRRVLLFGAIGVKIKNG